MLLSRILTVGPWRRQGKLPPATVSWPANEAWPCAKNPRQSQYEEPHQRCRTPPVHQVPMMRLPQSTLYLLPQRTICKAICSDTCAVHGRDKEDESDGAPSNPRTAVVRLLVLHGMKPTSTNFANMGHCTAQQRGLQMTSPRVTTTKNGPDSQETVSPLAQAHCGRWSTYCSIDEEHAGTFPHIGFQLVS